MTLHPSVGGVADVSVKINLRVQALLVWVDIGHIAATTSETLSSLTTTAQIVLLPGLGAVVSGLVSGILSPVLTLLLGTVIGGLAGIVSNTVGIALYTLRALPTATVALASPLLTVVSNVDIQLYLNGVVAVPLNTQNDPVSGLSEPQDLASLPAGEIRGVGGPRRSTRSGPPEAHGSPWGEVRWGRAVPGQRSQRAGVPDTEFEAPRPLNRGLRTTLGA